MRKTKTKTSLDRQKRPPETLEEMEELRQSDLKWFNDKIEFIQTSFPNYTSEEWHKRTRVSFLLEHCMLLLRARNHLTVNFSQRFCRLFESCSSFQWGRRRKNNWCRQSKACKSPQRETLVFWWPWQIYPVQVSKRVAALRWRSPEKKIKIQSKISADSSSSSANNSPNAVKQSHQSTIQKESSFWNLSSVEMDSKMKNEVDKIEQMRLKQVELEANKASIDQELKVLHSSMTKREKALQHYRTVSELKGGRGLW